MLALNFLLLACTQAPEPPVEAPAQRLEVEVTARIIAPGEPAMWTAVARGASEPPLTPQPLASGVCRRIDGPGAPAPSPGPGPRVADGLRITGLVHANLQWDEPAGVYRAVGPRQSVDPTWGVGDLAWRDAAGGSGVAEGVVRFGALPSVRFVQREEEGGVRLAWDPATVEEAQIVVTGAGGALVCGVGAAGVRLPWWAVPPVGGSVVLRTTRSRGAQLDEGVLVRARSTLELVVPLDAPSAASSLLRALPAPVPIPRATLRRGGRPLRNPAG